MVNISSNNFELEESSVKIIQINFLKKNICSVS